MRIVLTNDDGVHAPGLAALAGAVAAWARSGPTRHEVAIVAPLSNHSGAGAAVGTVFEREAIPYRVVAVAGADDVPAYGLDAPPALAVVAAAAGAFGPPPDIVLSGINLGVNVGRSILHSGTVGAVLSSAQIGISGMAVSMRSVPAERHWATAASLAVQLMPALIDAPAPTVFNLNVPSAPAAELRGLRRGRIGSARIIAGARAVPPTASAGRGSATGGDPSLSHHGGDRVNGVSAPFDSVSDALHGEAGRGDSTSAPFDSVSDRRTRGVGTPGYLEFGAPGDEGRVLLTVGAAKPSLGDVGDEANEDDGALIAAGFASITSLSGVGERSGAAADEAVQNALAACDRWLRLP